MTFSPPLPHNDHNNNIHRNKEQWAYRLGNLHGFAMALPDNYEAQIRPRSGLALKNGITVLNSPGTIDADYRGEVGVILINHGKQPFTVSRGDRIAQMIIAPFVQADFHAVAELSETERGSGGFGSSGKK